MILRLFSGIVDCYWFQCYLMWQMEVSSSRGMNNLFLVQTHSSTENNIKKTQSLEEKIVNLLYLCDKIFCSVSSKMPATTAEERCRTNNINIWCTFSHVWKAEVRYSISVSFLIHSLSPFHLGFCFHCWIFVYSFFLPQRKLR